VSVLVQPRPVDTDSSDPEIDHIVCGTVERTWCGLDARGMEPMPAPFPGLAAFCRVCVLAIEMYRLGDPCPVCGTRECINR
jgi:hypothetical protein